MNQVERYQAFRGAFSEREGFRSEYRGRYFYAGPAVVCGREELQRVVRESPVEVQWDSLGMDLIVYPK